MSDAPAAGRRDSAGASVAPAAAEASRMRIRFSKNGKVRFTSHRDVARIWERALRRAGVPAAYSGGFNPRPRIAFGLALSTGYSSGAEYLDVELDPARAHEIDDAGLVGALSAALPAGMAALAVARVARGAPSLQQSVTICTWRIDASRAETGLSGAVGRPRSDGGAPPAPLDAASVSRSVDRALSCQELLVERERKGRTVTEDIRPAVLAVEVEGNTKDGVRLIADLGTQPRAVRPPELLASLDPPLSALRVCRLHQWIATDATERREPLAVADMSVAQAGAEP